MVIGIEALGLRTGGGITHLKELLNHTEPSEFEFDFSVVVFASTGTLNQLKDAEWITKVSHPWLNSNVFKRILWTFFKFRKELSRHNCDILFTPGGGYFTTMRPFVTMSRNMLFYEKEENKRYGFHYQRFRNIMWRYLLNRNIRNASGVIFLSSYAQKTISSFFNERINYRIIHHGVSEKFRLPLKNQKPPSAYSAHNPYNLLYISTIDLYKHQWIVVEAIKKLRQKGIFVKLHLAGRIANNKANALLNKAKRSFQNDCAIVVYNEVNYDEIQELYKKADLFIYASTCENMPNILIEAMSAGLPVVCSSHEPMPEFLKDGGEYFDPTSIQSTADVIEKVYNNAPLRDAMAKKSSKYASLYNWKKCSSSTFEFLNECYNKNNKN